jgi:hypothetical protein
MHDTSARHLARDLAHALDRCSARSSLPSKTLCQPVPSPRGATTPPWGVPFKLKVADGDEYAVPHPDYIFLPPRSAEKRTYVMVHNDAGFASILPLLTITSLTYQIDANA